MRDALDRELNVGDDVVYATKKSTFVRLTQARVIEVEEGRVRVRRAGASSTFKPWLRHPEYIVLLEAISPSVDDTVTGYHLT